MADFQELKGCHIFKITVGICITSRSPLTGYEKIFIAAESWMKK